MVCEGDTCNVHVPLVIRLRQKYLFPAVEILHSGNFPFIYLRLLDLRGH